MVGQVWLIYVHIVHLWVTIYLHRQLYSVFPILRYNCRSFHAYLCLASFWIELYSLNAHYIALSRNQLDKSMSEMSSDL